MSALTFLLVDHQNSPNFLCPIGDEMSQLMKYFSDLHCIDPFWRYLRSKSKVLENDAKFWTFLTSQILLGATLPKLESTLSPLPRATSPQSFVGLFPVPQSYRHSFADFRSNFKCVPLKFWGDPRSGLWCALANLGQTLANFTEGNIF